MKIPDSRRALFRGINILLQSGGGSLHKPFPYTNEEMMRDRGTFWESLRRALRVMWIKGIK